MRPYLEKFRKKIFRHEEVQNQKENTEKWMVTTQQVQRLAGMFQGGGEVDACWPDWWLCGQQRLSKGLTEVVNININNSSLVSICCVYSSTNCSVLLKPVHPPCCVALPVGDIAWTKCWEGRLHFHLKGDAGPSISLGCVIYRFKSHTNWGLRSPTSRTIQIARTTYKKGTTYAA